MTVRVRATVHGVVQGVGFRAAAARAAADAGVAGWVRNRPDGSVEVDVEGDDDAVAAVVRFLRRGPEVARVDRVELHDLPLCGHRGFEVC